MEYIAQSLPGLENQSFLVIVLIAGLVVCGGVIAFMARFIFQILKEKDTIQTARIEDGKATNERVIILSDKTSENVRILNDVLDRIGTKRGK